MKKINISILLILCFTTNIIANVTGSLLRHQIRATNNVSTQINNLNKEVTNSIEKSLKRDSMKIVVSDFEKIRTQLDSISKKNLKAINGLNGTLKAQELCWLESALPHIIGALITAFVALWIYYCGWISERKRIRDKEDQIIEEKNDYFKSLFSSSIRASDNILIYLDIFCKDLDSDISKLPQMSISPMKDIKRLSKLIDDETYYHTFLNKYGHTAEAVKAYRIISAGIDYLVLQFSQIESRWINIEENYKNREKKYAAICSSIIFNEYVKVGESKFDAFIGFVNNFIDAFKKQNKKKFFILKDYQAKFTLPFTKKIEEKFLTIEKAKFLYKNLEEAESIYVEVLTQNESHLEDFLKIKSDINNVVNEIVSEMWRIYFNSNTYSNNIFTKIFQLVCKNYLQSN